MASDLLVKRLLKQAGVSVLAGLLLSSAVVAEDNATDASGVSVDGGGPDVSIDPVDPGLGGGDDGGNDDGTVDWSGEDDGTTDGTDDGTVDWSGDDDGITDGTDDGTVDWSGDDDGTTDGTDDGTVDWSGEDIDCAACFSIDVDVTIADGQVRGTQPNERNLDDVMSTTSVLGEPVAMNGEVGGTPAGGHEISRDFGNGAGRGAGRDGDLGAQRLRIVK